MNHARSTAIRRHAQPIGFVLAACVGLWGCGDLTAGGATGETAVVVSGDAADPVPSLALVEDGLARAVAPPALADAAAASGEDDHPEGELETDFSLALLDIDGGLTPLTDREVEVRLDLEGVEEPEVARRTVSAGRYSGLRIVFTKMEVEVDAGLVIAGDTVTGPIDVDFGDVELAVTRSLDLTVPDGNEVVLLVDLNAASWLQAVDVVSRTVDAETIAALIEVRIR